MTKEEFKKRWESNNSGGGITFRDIELCYIKWKLGCFPKPKHLFKVRYQVLKAANTIDAEEFNPEDE